MRPFESEAELVEALREMRPELEPDFAAQLDARAAAGFPRSAGWRAALRRAGARVSAVPRRRLLAAGGSVAVALVVVATALVAAGDPASEGTGETGGNTLGFLSRTADGGAPELRATEGAAEPSTALVTPGSSSAGSASAGSGPFAADAGRRRVERSAEIVLGADPDRVRADAGRVFSAVQAADGIVLDSSIRDGEAASARFDLLIPSDRLGDALAAISRIGEVRSRHEATRDITAPTVRTGERLRDSRARIEGLLGQLAEVTDEEERVVVESRLRAERRRVAALRPRLSSLRRRANLSHVSVSIESGPSAGGGAAWGVGDGVDGAARILAVAGGVAVIALAILAPLGLLALLYWLGHRAWVRRSRRTALSRA